MTTDEDIEKMLLPGAYFTLPGYGSGGGGAQVVVNLGLGLNQAPRSTVHRSLPSYSYYYYYYSASSLLLPLPFLFLLVPIAPRQHGAAVSEVHPFTQNSPTNSDYPFLSRLRCVSVAIGSDFVHFSIQFYCECESAVYVRDAFVRLSVRSIVTV